MVITVKKEDKKITLIPEGRIDTANAPEFEKAVMDCTVNCNELVFDFEKLQYISSAGLRVLLLAQKTMNKQGKMRVFNVCDSIVDVLNITGFVDILSIETNRDVFKANVLQQAMHFAVDAHGDTVRKGDGSPLVLHAMEAAAIVATMTQDSEVISAAVLHDTVEDADVTLGEIEERFGKRVAMLVSSETENKRKDMPSDLSWKIRKEESIELLKNTDDIAVKMIYLGDKLANMRAFYRSMLQIGDAMWEVFNQKDPEEHHWYYRTIADLLVQLKDYPVWQEYDNLIKKVFNENSESED